MSRNEEILRVFETADDSLQGVLGYHFYVTAMQKVADIGMRARITIFKKPILMRLGLTIIEKFKKELNGIECCGEMRK